MSSICFSIGIVCCSNGLQSLLPADSTIFDFSFSCFVLFLLFSGGPIWPYMFVVPDFSATLVTPSIWVMGRGGGAYLAIHICGAGFQCHTCNPFYVGYRGGAIWPYAFVVPDFGATRVALSIVGCRGGLFGHVCLWCQILVPHI